jgi:hypothetical protein
MGDTVQEGRAELFSVTIAPEGEVRPRVVAAAVGRLQLWFGLVRIASSSACAIQTPSL